MPEVLRTRDEVRQRVSEARKAGLRLGLVPTMGALHDGHGSLVKRSVAETDLTVVSIFVNPTQFGANEDFDRYPRQLDRDVAAVGGWGGQIVFAPSAEEMYSPDHTVWVDEERLSEGLCGARRPGHFRGVLTVCAKLFNIVAPQVAYFGKKDYQQYRLIQRMVRDLFMPLEIMGVEIVRQDDGLAMSSRNSYLSAEERRQAATIYRALQQGRLLIEHGEQSSRAVVEAVRSELGRAPQLRTDYIEVVEAETLEPAYPLTGKIVIAIAAYIGKTRLIDNVEVDCPEQSQQE